jgi:PKD repeat protein
MIAANFSANFTTGIVGCTDFVFTDTTVSTLPVVNYFWDLGDGNVTYNTNAVTHTYTYPGIYNVQLQATDSSGQQSTSVLSVTADYFIRDLIEITQIPPTFSKPGIPTTKPFVVSVTSAQISDTLHIQLFSSNSNSTPYNFVSKKWEFLVPTWRFTDSNHQIITELPVKTTPVYCNSKIVGSTGTAEFYYIDDLGVDPLNGDCALMLTLTLLPSSFYNPTDSPRYIYPSFANSKVTYTTILWQVNPVPPDYLKVTGNYLDKVHPVKWVNKKIPVLITSHSHLTDQVQLSAGQSGILYSHPGTNARGLKTSVDLSLQGVPASAYKVVQPSIHFQSTDANGSYTGGYVYADIIPLEPVTNTAVIATVTSNLNLTATKFSKPFGYSIPTYTWVSNPESNTLHRVTVVPYTESCSAIKAAKNNGSLVDGAMLTTRVPLISSTSTENYNLTGFSGVYGLAVDIREQDLLAADAESDTIYKYNSSGVLLSALKLRISSGGLTLSNGSGIVTSTGSTLAIGYQEDIALTPSYLSIDKNYNIWITLFNSVSVLKFDKDFNYLLAACPNDGYNIIQEDEWLFKPPVAETDKLNNIWVTYAQPLCSALFKYDQFGSVLYKIDLPINSIPVGVAVSPSNGVWVTNTMHSTPTGGNIQYYKSDGTLVNTITGFSRPSYIMLDKDANAWFTHGFRELGYIDSTTYATSSWTLTSNGILDSFKQIPIPNPNIDLYISEDEELGGLTIDALNRLWVIDSQKNIVHLLTTDSTTIATLTGKQIKILPDSIIGYAPNITTAITTVLSSPYYKSAQATGDWSGNRWLQKYGADDAFLTGVSDPFTVYDFNSSFRVKTVDENFNTAKEYKDLALPEHLKSNDFLFDDFFGAVVGNSVPSVNEDLGEKIYERIARFVPQHADLDVCSVEQLISHCNATDVENIEYTHALPAEIKKALDLFSVPKEKIRGVKDSIPIISKSVGKILNTETAILTAGKKIFLQNKFSSDYTLITIPLLSGLTVYPLTALDGTGFAQPITVNYLFYDYVPVYPSTEIEGNAVYIENIIDWNNEYTALSYNLSSKRDWYSETGVVENTFNYLITKNLFPDT